FDILPLEPVLTEAVELSGGRAKEKHIEITLDCDEDLRAQINPALLEQAVTNLVNNAVEYSRAESTVAVRACRDENEIRIEVRDSGCGISEKHQKRIFERFYVADKSRSRKAGGTGLGLAIVKHITQVHNGRISVNSQPGRGSCFTITLPVVP
ncbi:MAG: PAS domain-containing sensor histidine kinase, partial [Planctomycetota bacterium]